jgi:tetratricopeptide (TPR) repeat protein
MFALMPLYPFLTHWSDNEQREHWFGYWFGHDMFTPPFKDDKGRELYPEMTRDAILYGGTDPGRFCPTYMIFADSFLDEEDQPAFDKKFDRRDVYIITQNALADGTYLNYIRAHYNRSAQVDPPFFQELFRSERERFENYNTNFLARAVAPLDRFFMTLGDQVEKRRRTYTSWFTEKDFVNLPAFASQLAGRKDPVSAFLYEHLSEDTRKLLSDKSDALASKLAADLNVVLDRELAAREKLREKAAEKAKLDDELAGGSTSEKKQQRAKELEKEMEDLAGTVPLYTAERFKGVNISEYLADFIKENPQSHSRVRLNRLLLEAAYPSHIGRTKGGVYPDREMQIASPEDSHRCFNEYLMDAQRRLQLNQLKPGEIVDVSGGKVQVSGQVAVMAINGLITKVMFDKNPKNEFFVEESFPLDWMYPHLTPFGIIMKINRQPLAELSEEILNRDHQFWRQYSQRLIGDWITYDTSVKEIAEFVERVYLRRNFKGFKGDRKFVRDDQAQKAFSKLRSSIGGVYNWRIAQARPNSPEQARMIKEADFAFRQAFAFCPYSPEAVFRYINLLLSLQRFDDALIVAQTCQKLDPYNAQVNDLVERLKTFKQAPQAAIPSQGLAELEELAKTNPTNFQAAFNLAAAYLQSGQTNQALAIFDRVLSSSNVDANAVLVVAQVYSQIGNFAKLNAALERLVTVAPDSPEAWFDLAAMKAALGDTKNALDYLNRALTLSDHRKARDAAAQDLRASMNGDPRFNALRSLPEFQQLLGRK